MRITTYECEGGSLAIGTADARVQILNDWGDGVYTLFIHDSGEKIPDNAIFRGAVEGPSIKVFKYDCYTDEACTKEENIIAELSGRFGIFAIENSGDMILQKWQ